MRRIKWYSSLNGTDKKKGLRQDHEFDLTIFPDPIIIAKDVLYHSSIIKSFALFKDLDDFSKWCDDSDRMSSPHMYELIGGVHQKQRLYFDLDMNPTKVESPYELMEYVCDYIEKVLAKMDGFTTQKGIQIFSSFYPIDMETMQPSKYSFHLIVNGYYVDGWEQMRAFGLKVKEEIQSTYGEDDAKCVDNIWTRVRQLRLLGSSKIGKGSSPKQFIGIWHNGGYDMDEIEHRSVTLVESMVCNISNCEELHIATE